VLWPALVAAWGLSDSEARYIDIQQGTQCVGCRSNVRSIALAKGIGRSMGFEGPLTKLVDLPVMVNVRLLEINEAGSLHGVLSRVPGHRLISYPEYDMRQLPFDAGSYDLAVHSDTLEHVADPVRALAECRRILAARGALVFTVPVVIGRSSRTRAGLPPSYHGYEACQDPGMLVHTEFGADVWTYVLRAGFSQCEVVTFMFPAGLAWIARP